eukprot:gene8155-5684_t
MQPEQREPPPPEVGGAVVLHFSSWMGPLFVLDEPAKPALSTALHQHFPQMYKKAYGWRFSVEEMSFLGSLKPKTAAREEEGPLAHCHCPAVTILFQNAEVQQRYELLASRHREACTLYHLLTTRHNYALRHGSQFGALFIGYRKAEPLTTSSAPRLGHGEVLFFVPSSSPGADRSCCLTRLEAIRAQRVARSVGKKAVLVHLLTSPSPQATDIMDRAADDTVIREVRCELLPVEVFSSGTEENKDKEERQRAGKKRYRVAS